MEYLPSIVLWAAIIGYLVYTLVIKKNKNRREAENGGDRERYQSAVKAMLKEPESFRLAYAHWEEQESYGRTVKTTYHRYGLAFKDQMLCVFPLGIDKKTREVQAARPVVLTPENLGKVRVKAKEKDGTPERLEIWLGDKKGHVIQELTVDGENLRKNRWFPVNILQREECGALRRFIDGLAQQVERENPEVDALIQAESNEGIGVIGAVVSGIGAVFSLFFPPAGLAMCLIGLVMALVSKLKGTTTKKWLLISGACMVFALGFSWFYLKYIFV